MSARPDDSSKRGFRENLDRFTLALALISALGAALVLARQAAYGAALHADSIFYIDAARNLLAGEGFETFARDGQAMQLTHWPPLYPLALAAPGVFGIDARDVAGPLNAAIFGLTAFAVGRWARRRLESKALAIWGCAAVALAPPLAEMASWALTETPFILLATLALIRADDFLQEEGRRSALIWAAALSALALLTRYIGVALIGAILALVVLRPGASGRGKALDAAVCALIAVLPSAPWLLRNVSLTGTLFGIRREPPANLPETLTDGAVVMAGWFAPGLWSDDFQLIAVCVSAIGLGAICAAAAWALASSRGAAWSGRRSIVAFGAFAAAYVASFLLSMISQAGIIHDRYWIPLYVPLLLVALLALDRFMSARGGEARMFADLLAWVGNAPARLGSPALAAALAAWLIFGAARGVGDVLRVNAESVRNSYSAAEWINSETLEYLRENPRRGRVITNNAHMVYIHAGGGWDYGALPAFSRRTANASLDDVLDAAIEAADGEILVVWLDNWYRNDEAGYGVETLRASPRLEVEAELSDGAVFRLKPDGARPVGDIPAKP